MAYLTLTLALTLTGKGARAACDTKSLPTSEATRGMSGEGSANMPTTAEPGWPQGSGPGSG